MAATDQEIVDALRDAILKLSTGAVSSYTVHGVTYEYHQLDKMRETLRYFESRITETTANTNGRMVPIDISRSRT